MNTRASAERMARATKLFLNSWEQTKRSWRDSKAREFDKKFITALPDTVTSTMRVIEELDKILTKARRDCE